MAVETIGSASRQRTNPQTWFDAQLAVLLADPTGECYNDSEFTTSSAYVFSGITPGAFSLTLKCATGQSFKDNASVRSNALKYNASNGVGIRQTSGYSVAISGSQSKINFAGLQIKNDGTGGTSDAISLTGDGSFTDCFIHASWTVGVALPGAFPMTNCVVFMAHSAGTGIVSQSSSTFRHVSIVRSSDQSASGAGFASQYSTNTLINCSIFGFSTCCSGSYTGSSNNATSNASGLPGTSNQHSVTYSQSTPFTDADKDSLDLRAIASTSLAANGVYNASYPTDISDYTRPNPPTIGHWQITSAAGGSLVPANPSRRARRVLMTHF